MFSLAVPLQEKTILNLGEFHGRGALFVVVHHVVDPCAHGIAAHQAGIEGLQKFRHRSHILHSRIEPEVIAVRVKDDWHSVVDG